MVFLSGLPWEAPVWFMAKWGDGPTPQPVTDTPWICPDRCSVAWATGSSAEPKMQGGRAGLRGGVQGKWCCRTGRQASSGSPVAAPFSPRATNPRLFSGDCSLHWPRVSGYDVAGWPPGWCPTVLGDRASLLSSSGVRGCLLLALALWSGRPGLGSGCMPPRGTACSYAVCLTPWPRPAGAPFPSLPFSPVLWWFCLPGFGYRSLVGNSGGLFLSLVLFPVWFCEEVRARSTDSVTISKQE